MLCAEEHSLEASIIHNFNPLLETAKKLLRNCLDEHYPWRKKRARSIKTHDVFLIVCNFYLITVNIFIIVSAFCIERDCSESGVRAFILIILVIYFGKAIACKPKGSVPERHKSTLINTRMSGVKVPILIQARRIDRR